MGYMAWMMRRVALAAVLAVTLTAVVVAPSTAKPKLRASDAALAKAVNGYWRGLGFHRDATAAVKAAHLPKAVARALTAELRQLHACDVITRSHINTVLQFFDQFTAGHTGFPLGQPPVNPIPV